MLRRIARGARLNNGLLLLEMYTDEALFRLCSVTSPTGLLTWPASSAPDGRQ